MVKKTQHTFVKIAKITAVYIAANFLKLMVSNSRKIYYDDVLVTYSASKYQSIRTLVNIFVLNSHNKLQIMLIENKIFL